MGDKINCGCLKTKSKDKNVELERAVELEDDFRLEFEKALELLCNTYPRVSRVKKYDDLTENSFKIVIYTVLLNSLRDIQQDSSKMTMREFHKKYVPNLPILFRCDFTGEEFSQIIKDSYLKQRDKNIAYKFFVEKKNTNEVHAELENDGEVGDKKTVDNNLDTINDALLYRACIYNKDNSK